jgi:hypothetical protein
MKFLLTALSHTIGLIFDSAGVSFTVFLGGLCGSLGYVVMSFGQSVFASLLSSPAKLTPFLQSYWIAILFGFMLTGFGCGASFISVLGFGLKVVSHNPGTKEGKSANDHLTHNIPSLLKDLLCLSLVGE